MEITVDSGGVPASPTHIPFTEVTLGATGDDPAFVHAFTGDGSPTFVRFVNGCPPTFNPGVRFSMWSFENEILATGVSGFRVDLKGPCNWLWRNDDSKDSVVKPIFGEFFAGLGGWTKGLQSMQMSSRVLVEIDPKVAKACAVCLHIPLITVNEAYDMICQGVVPPKCVLLGDLMEVKTWTVISFYQLEVACMSPPCQPWSRASRETGLLVKDGKVFAQVVRMSPMVGIKVINAENVGAITVHPHFKHLIRFVEQQLYEIVHSVVIDSYPYLPIRRERWLVSICKKTFRIPDLIKEWAGKIKFPGISQGVATLASRDCVQEHFGEGEWIEMMPCPQAIIMMNNPDYLPNQFGKLPNQSVYQSRICNQDMPIGGAMAMYGKQHTLPVDLLKQKGLFTSLFRKEGSHDPPRYYTAWEFLAAMQWPMDTYLPNDKHDAWHAAGNAICIPHTVLCLFRMHGCLGDKSPWGDTIISLRKICWNVFEKSIKLSCMVPEVVDDLKRLTFVSNEEVQIDDTPKKRVSRVETGMQITSPKVPEVPKQEQQKSSAAPPVVEVVDCTPENQAFVVSEKAEGSGIIKEEHETTGGNDCNHIEAITGTFTKVLRKTFSIIDLDKEEQDIAPVNLHDRFEQAANENKIDRIFKKRAINDEDTWHFEKNDLLGFLKNDPKAIENFFACCTCEEMKLMMTQVMHKSGIPKIWPMHRQVMLINPKSRWSCVTIVAYGQTVMNILQEFLPYARPNQFYAVRVNDKDVSPQSVPPGIDSIIVSFVPVEALCNIETPDGTKIQGKVDATTKFRDLTMFVSQRTGLHCESVSVYHKGRKMHAAEPVCLCDSPDFQVRHNTVVKLPSEIPIVAMKPEIIIPPFHSDIMISSQSDTIRFSIRHPVWSSVRTVTASVHESVETMLNRLIPDMKNNCKVSLGSQTFESLNDIEIGSLNIGVSYEVNFAASKPYPTTKLEIILPCDIVEQMALGKKNEQNPNQVCRWIRTPFQTKAYEQWFDGSITVCGLVAQYFAHCQSQQTVLAMVDGKAVDPRIELRSIPTEKILTLRSCPLVGGGKEKDKDVKKILWDQFSARGVPEDLVQSRIEGFLAKITPDKIRTHAGETWARQWVSLKQLANEAHFRLITTDELRAYQNKRKTDKYQGSESIASTKPSSAGSSVSTRQSNENTIKKLNLQEICLDMSYFKAESGGVQMISVENFGPDSSGVTVMHAESAVKYLPIKRLSAEHLAIISVGNKPLGESQIRMAPATNGKGEPILVPICILNFGDVSVSFQEGTMKAVLPTQEAMVIEFTIYRSEVETWEDVKSPLVYMGKKIAETKTTKVLSTWAIKSYSNLRKVVSHADAEYIHGYMRVLESQADPFLARSGWFGIYLTPKNQMKKPHESYSIVAVPNKGIEHLQALVQSTKNTLGIVKTSNALAVRCRREHIFTIRKHIFPELPLQEEGVYAPGDKLYVLKYLESHTNTSELTQALRTLGWEDAKALKPLGPSSWSIAAPSDPPSSHVCLNSDFVVIVAQGRPNVAIRPAQDVPPTAAFIGDRLQKPATEPSVNRFEELKQELNGQVQALVEAKIQESSKEIQGLKQSLNKTNENIEKLKDAQVKTETKISEVESAVQASGESLLTRLNGMFGDLQNNICQRLDRLEAPQEEKETKRPRL